MYILAVETTGPYGSVAVIDEKGHVEERSSCAQMSHLKELIPMTEALLSDMHIDKKEITAIGASIGPGSFTGIRIGVATARALAQALSIPAVSVPTLDSFKVMCSGETLVVPILNARRGQVYGGVFDEKGADILKSGPYMLTDVFASLNDVFSRSESHETEVMFFGDGVDAYSAEIKAFTEETGRLYPGVKLSCAEEDMRYQRAQMTARIALQKYNAGETVSYEKLQPDYMRATEAETKLKDGSLARERAAKMARFRAR